MFTLNNFHEGSFAEFKPLDKNEALELLYAYQTYKRSCAKMTKSKPSRFFKTKSGIEYELIFDGEAKRYHFVKKRSLSMYFRKKGSKSIIRISDHWSKSKYTKSKKLNCGSIRTCYWTLENVAAERFEFSGFASGKYAWVFMAGVCALKKFQPYQNRWA